MSFLLISASPEKGLRQVIGQDVPAGTYRIPSATAQEWPVPLRIRPDSHVNPLQDYSIWKVTQLQQCAFYWFTWGYWAIYFDPGVLYHSPALESRWNHILISYPLPLHHSEQTWQLHVLSAARHIKPPRLITWELFDCCNCVVKGRLEEWVFEAHNMFVTRPEITSPEPFPHAITPMSRSLSLPRGKLLNENPGIRSSEMPLRKTCNTLFVTLVGVSLLSSHKPLRTCHFTISKHQTTRCHYKSPNFPSANPAMNC